MYTVTVLPVYAEGDGPQISQKGKTSKWLQNDISHTEKLYISIWRRFGHISSISLEPLGSVRNLQVTDPTISTLNVRWEPAEGNVREYIVIYVATGSQDQEVVRMISMYVPEIANKTVVSVATRTLILTWFWNL